VPNNNFLTSLAIGLTAVQSSLPCFAAERAVYWREANRGLSKSAYFLGTRAPALHPLPWSPPCSENSVAAFELRFDLVGGVGETNGRSTHWKVLTKQSRD